MTPLFSSSLVSPAPLFLLGVALLAVAMIVAWNERRRAEMLRKLSDERSGLLRLTLHQLGEPLTILKWGLEILMEREASTRLEDVVPEHIAVMQDGISRLNSIIDTLQLAEKVENKSLAYKAEQTPLRKLVDEILGTMKARAESSKIAFDVSIDQSLAFPFDQNLIGMVIRMLIENAVDYSPQGETIFVEAVSEGEKVVFSVRDHGCGIPEKDLPRMFEKYVRASNAHLKKPDGSGLGLYIAKGIVEIGGGEISVESKVGLGTKFTVTLPLRGLETDSRE